MKENLETIYKSQESRIDKFIESQTADESKGYTVRYNNGAVTLVTTAGEGDALAENGMISFYYAAYPFTGSVPSKSALVATNNLEVATAAGWDTSDAERFNPLVVHLSESGFVEGLKKGLAGARKGEIAYVLFSGKYGFCQRQVGLIPANSAMIYQIWVDSVSNN